MIADGDIASRHAGNGRIFATERPGLMQRCCATIGDVAILGGIGVCPMPDLQFLVEDALLVVTIFRIGGAISEHVVAGRI